jgi:predicted RNA methylase
MSLYDNFQKTKEGSNKKTSLYSQYRAKKEGAEIPTRDGSAVAPTEQSKINLQVNEILKKAGPAKPVDKQTKFEEAMDVTSAGVFSTVARTAGATQVLAGKGLGLATRAGGVLAHGFWTGLGKGVGLLDEGIGKQLEKVADSMYEESKNVQETLKGAGYDNSQFLNRGGETAKEIILKDTNYKKYMETRDEDFDIKDLKDPNFLKYDLYMGLIENSGPMALSIYAGSKARAASAAYGKVAQFFSAVSGGTAFSLGQNAAMEAETTYADALNEGLSKDEAYTRAERTFNRNLAGNSAWETAQMMLLFSPQMKATGPFMKILLNGAKIAGAGVLETVQERGEDAIQEQAAAEKFDWGALAEKVTDPNITKTDIVSAALGMIMQGGGNLMVKDTDVNKQIERQAEAILESTPVNNIYRADEDKATETPKGSKAVEELEKLIETDPETVQEAYKEVVEQQKTAVEERKKDTLSRLMKDQFSEQSGVLEDIKAAQQQVEQGNLGEQAQDIKKTIEKQGKETQDNVDEMLGELSDSVEAQEDWQENYADDYAKLTEKIENLEKELKNTKDKTKKAKIEDQITELNNKGVQMENDFIEKYQKKAEKAVRDKAKKAREDAEALSKPKKDVVEFTADQIRAEDDRIDTFKDAIVARRESPIEVKLTKKDRADKKVLQKKRKEIEKQRDKDIERLRELEEKGSLAMNEYDRTISSGGDLRGGLFTDLSLVQAHISYANSQLDYLDDVIVGKDVDKVTKEQDSKKTQPKKKRVVAKKAPTETVAKLEQELRDAYSKVEKEKFDEALGQTIRLLDMAEAGQRVQNEDGEFTGIPSTFPEWIPEKARKKPSVNALTRAINDLDSFSYPTNKRATVQREFYDAFYEQLDHMLDIDTSIIRHKILYEYGEKDTKEPQPLERSSGATDEQLGELWGDVKKEKEQGQKEEVKKETPVKVEKKPEPQNALEMHQQTISDLRDGKGSLEAYRAGFDAVVANKDTILEELGTKTKPELLKMLGSFSRYQYKNDRKATIVDAVYSDMLMDYALGKTVSYTIGFGDAKDSSNNAIKKIVDSATERDLKDFAEKVAEARKAQQERMSEVKKALENPETLEEFRTFIKVKGKKSLTPKQEATYNDFFTREAAEKQRKEQEAKATVQGMKTEAEWEMVETKHTKTGEDLFVVKTETRLERDAYKEVLSRAKKLGGWYSSYRAQGAVPGFQFKTKENAEQFMQVLQGETIKKDTTEKVEKKTEKQYTKLRELADSLEEKAQETLSQDRQTNTARRAAMASGIEAKAEGDIAMAQTMRNIAAKIEEGDTLLLGNVTTRTQVEELQTLLNQVRDKEAREKNTKKDPNTARHEWVPVSDETYQYTERFPFPLYHLEKFLEQAQNIPGFKRQAKGILTRLQKSGKNGYEPKSVYEMDEIAQMGAKMGLSKYDVMYGAIQEYKRFRAMGVSTTAELRSLLKEYAESQVEAKGVDKVKQMERDIIGRKGIGIDFFPTPKSVATQMVQEADIRPGMSVLEPSAGNGNIAEVIRDEAGVEPDVAELSSDLRDILEAKGFNVVGQNFMDIEDKYDRIIMNPPFSKGMDIDHIKHAYSLLKENGGIVSIMGEGAFIRSDKKATEFREWLETHGGFAVELPAGTFKDTDLLANTGANARMVYITKVPTLSPEDIPFQRTKTDSDKTALEKERMGELANTITTVILNELGGKTSVSRQFISDLTNKGELRQAERDLIRETLAEVEGDKIDVPQFADRVRAKLLPLDTSGTDKRLTEYGGKYKSTAYEGVTLPDELRGNVADYTERIYESPIKTSAGNVHFPDGDYDNYFAHTRIEDMAAPVIDQSFYDIGYGKGKAPKNSGVRRVIEIQSDLFQKGRLETEYGGVRAAERLSNNTRYIDTVKKMEAEDGSKASARAAEVEKLQPYRNTWHERIIREEIKKAAQDGKTKLQFPTGETAMKIEGLGDNTDWRRVYEIDGRRVDDKLEVGDLKVGEGILRDRDNWIITEVLEDGKFKAVQKRRLQSGNIIDTLKKGTGRKYEALIKELDEDGFAEQFDISGKVDTDNPIYKFYEKDVQKFLKRIHPEMQMVTDEQGVTWWEIAPKKEEAVTPVLAFSRGKSLDQKLASMFGEQDYPSTPEQQIAELQEIADRLKVDMPYEVAYDIFTGESDQSFQDNQGRANAVFYKDKIWFSKQSVTQTTAFHEMIHFAMTRTELFDVLDGVNMHEIYKEANGGKEYTRKDIVRLQEVVAEKAEAYITEQKKNGLSGTMIRFFEKIKVLMNKIGRALGYDNTNINDFIRIVAYDRSSRQQPVRVQQQPVSEVTRGFVRDMRVLDFGMLDAHEAVHTMTLLAQRTYNRDELGRFAPNQVHLIPKDRLAKLPQYVQDNYNRYVVPQLKDVPLPRNGEEYVYWSGHNGEAGQYVDLDLERQLGRLSETGKASDLKIMVLPEEMLESTGFADKDSVGERKLGAQVSFQKRKDPLNLTPDQIKWKTNAFAIGLDIANGAISKKDGLKRIAEIMQRFNQSLSPDQRAELYGTQNEKDLQKDFFEFQRAKGPNLNQDMLKGLERPIYFKLSKETRGEAFLRKVQDVNTRLKVAQAQLREQGARVVEDTDIFLQKTLLPRRIGYQFREFDKKVRKPFVESLADAGLTLDEMDLYSHALHAPTRNALMQQRGFEGDNGSGMTDKQAHAILDKFEKDGKTAELEKHREKLREVQLNVLALDISNGLRTIDEVKALMSIYGKDYVPLSRQMLEEDESGVGSGVFVRRGTDIRGKESRRAKGSQRDVLPITAQIFNQYERAVLRGEKNKVALALKQFIEDNNKEGEMAGLFNVYRQQYIPRFDEVGELQFMDPLFVSDPQTIGAKEGGKQWYIYIKDERFAQSLKETGMTRGVPYSGMFIQYLSRMITQYSPVFMVRNLQRDFFEGIINLQEIRELELTGEQAKGLSTNVAKNVPSMIRNLYRYKREKDTKHAELFDRFEKAGGEVGYFWQENAMQAMESLESIYKAYKNEGFEKIKNPVRKAGEFIDAANSAVELGIRVSVFDQLTKRGMSDQKAAGIAGNLTVDFNKKGELGPVLKSLYIFVNPAIQGPYRVYQAFTNSKRVRYATGAMIALGFVNSIISQMLGGDDDDDIPEYVKNTRIVFATPEGNSVTLFYLPYGYNSFWALGRNTAELFAGKRTVTETVSDTLVAAVDSFSPLGGADFSPTEVVPTAAKPLFEIYYNKAWYGGPIKPEQPPYGAEIPNSERYWDSVGNMSKWIAQTLNKVTGGNERKSGFIDISPEDIEYATAQYTGTVGTLIKDTFETIGAVLTGNTEDLKKSHVPFVRDYYREIDTKRAKQNIIYPMLDQSQRKDFNTLQTKRYMNAVDALLKEEQIDQEYAEKLKEDFNDNQHYLRTGESTEISAIKSALSDVESGSDRKDAFDAMVYVLEGENPNKSTVTKLKKQFVTYETFGFDDPIVNDLMSGMSNAEKVKVLELAREEMGEKAFEEFFKKGRKTVTTASGNKTEILISDALRELYLESTKN